jgi:hypothetical protein
MSMVIGCLTLFISCLAVIGRIWRSHFDILMWLYLCLLPFFEATTSCCWRSYCYCRELLHSGFRSIEKPPISLQCVMNEIHVVGFAFYRSMHGISCFWRALSTFVAIRCISLLKSAVWPNVFTCLYCDG